jgi:hypothetical protein
MLAMFARSLSLPSRSFLLLGPCGTGKTTWLRRKLPRALWYNLLLDRELPLQAGPVRVLPLHAFARELVSGRLLERAEPRRG